MHVWILFSPYSELFSPVRLLVRGSGAIYKPAPQTTISPVATITYRRSLTSTLITKPLASLVNPVNMLSSKATL